MSLREDIALEAAREGNYDPLWEYEHDKEILRSITEEKKTKYYCLNCGWEGEDIIKWEEHPRDEFYLKCPKCHHIDMDIMRFDGEVWVPAVVYREPTPEEIERGERFLQRLNQMLASTNVYLKAVYQIQEREE